MRTPLGRRIARAALPLALVAVLVPIGAAAARRDKAGEKPKTGKASKPVKGKKFKEGTLAGKSVVTTFGARPLKIGMSGKDVRVLQRSLTTLGFITTVDGIYAKATFASVKSLERTRRWRIDGKVSKKDATRIAALATPTTGYYLGGIASPSLDLTAQRAGSAQVDVRDASGNPVASIPVSFSSAGIQTVSWMGLGAAGYVPDGTYLLKLADAGTANATVSGGQTTPFTLHARAFPVLGTHSFGGAASRFGAPRAGHTHQGQDVAAACGTRLLVAEGGTLRVESYQASGAGYYIVIHGAISGTDYVYMHLLKPSWAVVNQTVYTGQQIAKVGNTGASMGCHLHFERWTAPGWYLGGAPYDPLAELQAWDAYS